MTHDLVLRGGRVIDPASGHDGVADVAFAGGRVAEVGAGLEGAEVRDAAGLIVMPGLIDLHTHVYWGGTSLGVDPDDYGQRCAATTLVDAGSAGPGNFAGFEAHLIRPARDPGARRSCMSRSPASLPSPPPIMVGESHDPRLIAAREAVAVARDHPDTIVGIKIRVGRIASGPSGIAPLDVALDVADRAGLPLMAHIDEAPPTYSEVVGRLRAGDILTHCYRPFPNAPVRADGSLRDGIREARNARRPVRYWPRHGLVLVGDGAGDAGAGLCAGRDLVGRPCAVPGRAGAGSGLDDDQVPRARDGAAGHRAPGDARAGGGHRPRRSRPPRAGGGGRCEPAPRRGRPGDAGGRDRRDAGLRPAPASRRGG